MLRPNSQRQHDPILNHEKNDNPPIGQKEYRNGRGLKDSKA